MAESEVVKIIAGEYYHAQDVTVAQSVDFASAVLSALEKAGYIVVKPFEWGRGFTDKEIAQIRAEHETPEQGRE